MAERFRNLVNELNSEFALKKKLLEETEARLETERKKLDTEKNVMSKVEVSNDDIVPLNVGGRVFTTRRGTLRLVEGSVLELMFSGRWEDRVDRDKDGNVFFDLDPDLFNILLRYLTAIHTYGKAAEHLTFRNVPKDLEEEFRMMLKYLGLTELLSPSIPFRFSPTLHSKHVILDGKDYNLAISDGSGVAVRHHALSDFVYHGGVFKFKIKIEDLEDWLMIGVIGDDIPIAFGDDACCKPTSYGWGSDKEVFVNGVESKSRGYCGRTLAEGDEYELILDCRYSFLMLKTNAGGRELEYKISQLPNRKWRVLVATYYGSSVISINAAK